MADLEIKLNKRTRRFDVAVPLPNSKRHRWVTTGATTRAAAHAVVNQSGVDRLVFLANAGALTSEAVALVTAGRKVTGAELLIGWASENEGRWSDGTARKYRIYLNAFLDFAGCHKETLSTVTRETLNRFVNDPALRRAGRSGRLAAVRSLYAYARAHNFVGENLAGTVFIRAREMTVEQLETRRAEPLTEAQFRAIIEASDTPDFWKSATSIAYWTGLRFIDCVCLEWASVTADSLVVWTKKRGKRVALPLDDPLLGAGELRAVLSSIPRSGGPFCFPAERAAYLSGRRTRFPTAFAAILKRWGINNRSFHSCRHSFITRLRRAGKTLLEIGTLVGHGSTEQTAAYVHD